MDFYQLHTFLEIVRLKSFSKAAQTCFRTQPAISAQVRQLEQELRAEYETQIAAMPKTEYHARHILVATEPFAQKVVERLNKGEKLEVIAKSESMDSSKNNGGDLGWADRNSFVKPFADAVFGMKVGEIAGPIKT